MITYPVLDTPAKRKAYHDYLQSDHDYSVWVDVTDLDERFVARVDVLDGQINIRNDDGPSRTGSLVLSDPEGSLSFGDSYTRDDQNVLWVNRLVRINHEVVVPGIGPVRAIPAVGVPTSSSRSGGEVSLEWGDKSLLSDHGVRPANYKKGQNVRSVLIHLLGDLCGETHFRIPATKKVLSRSYSVGMGTDSLTPWDAFVRIANREAGWWAFYSCDGFATCQSPGSGEKVKVYDILSLPDSATSFTDFVNYAKVTSSRQKTEKVGKKKKEVEITTIYDSIAVLPRDHELSEQSLGRHITRKGQRILVPRTLPLVVSDDDLKSASAVRNRAVRELRDGSSLTNDRSIEIIPFFDLDEVDSLDLPAGIGSVRLQEASIPLGTGGNMSLGSVKWVSRPVTVKRTRDKKTVKRHRDKGGKKKGKKSGK